MIHPLANVAIIDHGAFPRVYGQGALSRKGWSVCEDEDQNRGSNMSNVPTANRNFSGSWLREISKAMSSVKQRTVTWWFGWRSRRIKSSRRTTWLKRDGWEKTVPKRDVTVNTFHGWHKWWFILPRRLWCQRQLLMANGQLMHFNEPQRIILLYHRHFYFTFDLHIPDKGGWLK